MTRTIMLDQLLVEARLKQKKGGVTWFISRLGTRELQERVIGFWNEHGRLPEDLGAMPRTSPGLGSAFRQEAL